MSGSTKAKFIKSPEKNAQDPQNMPHSTSPGTESTHCVAINNINY